jgi:cytochrome c biogenesis protein CcdA
LIPSLALGVSLQGNVLLLRAVGVILILLGAVRGFTGILDRVPHLSLDGKTSGLLGNLAWGAGYGVSSLGCSLPVFLLVVLQGSAAATPMNTLTLFAAFSLGSAALLIPISVGVALAEETVADKLLDLLPYVKKAAAALMIIAGLYMIWGTR